ncbi:MAG: porphobilinogen synthase [Planctomycetales bacterium]|nr:porphobilinogen synthase [Planctomycetales bacterium]MBN8629051.1 porphobilinogen synthase [Planctomycetota bacterium]
MSDSFSLGSFPTTRMRRLRQHPQLRALTRSTRLHPSQFVYPLFVRGGKGVRQEIASMPGVFQLSLDELEKEVREVAELGIGGVLLFGIPEKKDAVGKDSYSDDGVIQQALRVVKKAAPQLYAITDVCFCEYTDHGHCGVLDQSTGRIDVNNDATLELLGKQAVSHAKAGADMVAPSGMMDGMVGAIRKALDGAALTHIPIMAYSAKFSGGFYGPFRDAAESTPQFGDRRSYQMDSAADPAQALRETALDIAEGADVVMVKPALAYLDIVSQVSRTFPGVPLAAYNVSGEYSMVKAAAARGWIDERSVATEIVTGIVRAGATIVITYWAKDLARWLKQ